MLSFSLKFPQLTSPRKRKKTLFHMLSLFFGFVLDDAIWLSFLLLTQN